MKKKISIIAVIICCFGFSYLNVIKSGIKDLRFLLSMSSETLANAEAIDGNGEGGEQEECPPEFNLNQVHDTQEKWATPICRRMGMIEIPGYVFYGDYAKGNYYQIHYKEHYCKEQEGFCCESTMGVEIIYD